MAQRTLSMREYDPRRFGTYADKDWQVTKAKEDYCLRHEIPFPHFNRPAGRPIKPRPLHETLKDKGAVFEEVYGHERPRWFARDDVEQHDHYSFRRNVVHDVVGAEVQAVRQAAGIMGISAFTKVEIAGPDAKSVLDRLVANRLSQKTGGIALTHMLNARGRIELETTVVKLDEDRYYLVCTAFFEQRLLDHLVRHRDGADAAIITRSDDRGAITLNGPRSREVLSQCTSTPLDNGSLGVSVGSPPGRLSLQATRSGPSACPIPVNWAGNSMVPGTGSRSPMRRCGRRANRWAWPIMAPLS